MNLLLSGEAKEAGANIFVCDCPGEAELSLCNSNRLGIGVKVVKLLNSNVFGLVIEDHLVDFHKIWVISKSRAFWNVTLVVFSSENSTA